MMYTVATTPGNDPLLHKNELGQTIAMLYACEEDAQRSVSSDSHVQSIKDLLVWLEQAEKLGATHVVEVGFAPSESSSSPISDRINDLRTRETVSFDNWQEMLAQENLLARRKGKAKP